MLGTVLRSPYRVRSTTNHQPPRVDLGGAGLFYRGLPRPCRTQPTPKERKREGKKVGDWFSSRDAGGFKFSSNPCLGELHVSKQAAHPH